MAQTVMNPKRVTEFIMANIYEADPGSVTQSEIPIISSRPTKIPIPIIISL
jgi:hypothetical protein